MKTISISLGALAATFLLGPGTASAASPSYCEVYADAYLRHAQEQPGVPRGFIHDRAYHICLNLDDEPVLPTERVDPVADRIAEPIMLAYASENYGAEETDVAEATAEEPPIDETSVEENQIEESLVGDIPVEEAVAAESDPTPDTDDRIVAALEKWSPEWRTWCREHYPNSFDPETGTVVPYDTGIRTEC